MNLRTSSTGRNLRATNRAELGVLVDHTHPARGTCVVRPAVLIVVYSSAFGRGTGREELPHLPLKLFR